jgi:lipopolysaccharide/colanic/teichoic acid biosynthesis glycosyltransferase
MACLACSAVVFHKRLRQSQSLWQGKTLPDTWSEPMNESTQPVGFNGGSTSAPSAWCTSATKRCCDLVAASSLLAFLFLPMIIIAIGVKLTSRGPVFFRQRRPGKNGREFSILKFRTMIDKREDQGPAVTRAADPRITRFGGFIRKWKLDEFPQLFNVLRGEMSLVGPRPHPTRLWREPGIPEDTKCVLRLRPGITSEVTVNFRNEEELLRRFSAEEVEEVYVKTIMPLKLQMEIDYSQRATFASDALIILKTAWRLFNRKEPRSNCDGLAPLGSLNEGKMRAVAKPVHRE